MKPFSHARRTAIAGIIAPFVSHERFVRLKFHRQHVFFSRYEHLLHTAELAYRMARFFRADVRTCVLAGLLHDFHETRVKGYRHGMESATNARAAGISDERVLSIIRAHMFPFGWGKVPTPWTREFAVVKAADFVAATVEFAYGFFDTAFAWNFRPSFRFKSTRKMLEYVGLETVCVPCSSSSTNP